MNKDFVYNYLKRRDLALSKEQQEVLREEIYNIKKTASGNLKELVELAKINLENNGVKVFIVKNNSEATEKIKELVGQSKGVVKAKSNTLDKFNLKDVLGDSLTETDLGAYIVSQIGNDSDHPVLPSIDLTAEEVAIGFEKKTGQEYPKSAKELVDILKNEIKKKILTADFGLTGANAVTADGQIMLLENEGNISLITRLPKNHIAVCGVEKVVAETIDGIKIAQASAVWGTGQKFPTYLSFISGPSKTADIENELVVGVQGAQEVVLILIEGEAYQRIGTEAESMNYCIHCGACYNLCPTWNAGFGMPKVGKKDSIFNCTLCQNCTLNCPAKIEWQNIVRIYRDRYNKEGDNTENNLKMIDNIRKFGNPFGEKVEGSNPDELFCC